MCNQKIWIKRTLSLSKERGVITKKVLLLKYQKQARTASLNMEDALMLLPTALRKLWIYQVLPFIVSRNILPIGNKFLIGDFDGMLIINFFPDLESEIVVWSVDKFIRKLMKKKVSFKELFFQASRNPVRKRNVYKTKLVIQNSATKYYHKFHLRSHKDLEMLILVAPFLLPIKPILQ